LKIQPSPCIFLFDALHELAKHQFQPASTRMESVLRVREEV
jgi:hypothetical protein